MAVTLTATIYASADVLIVEGTAAADADFNALTIPHGMATAPDEVEIIQRTNGSTAAGAVCGYTWTADATNVVVTKVGTFAGAAGVFRVVIRRIHHQRYS